MTTVASAVLFRSESKGSGFNANECPQGDMIVNDHFWALFT